MNMTNKFLNKKYNYGGELMTLGAIIIDLQKNAPSPQCVDKYLQGLFLREKIRKDRGKII